MDTRILSIKLSQEAKQWDSMVTKIYQFLAETSEDRQALYNKNKDRQEARILKEQESAYKRLATKQGKTLEEVKEINKIRKEKEKLEEEKRKRTKGRDYESGFNKNKIEDTLKKKKHAQKTFNPEEKELIACAFKGRLQELVEGITKTDILIKKSKFEMYRNELERFKNGLLQNFLEEALTMRMVIAQLCIEISGHPVGLMFFYKLKADIYRYLAQYQNYFTSIAKGHQDQIKDTNNQEDEVVTFLGRFYPDVLIESTDSPKDVRHKNDLREQKFNFTKKANTNYKKALFIEEYYKSKVLQKQSQQLASGSVFDDNDENSYKISSLSLAITLNYSVFLWGIKKDQKKALRLIKRKLQESLEDFELWEKDEMESIKKQIQLMQENINMWKETTDTDSEEEN